MSVTQSDIQSVERRIEDLASDVRDLREELEEANGYLADIRDALCAPKGTIKPAETPALDKAANALGGDAA